MERSCMLCPRRCGADRTVGAGRCGEGTTIRAARAALHFWEEPILSGTRGSGAIFFSGCSLRCVYCQNAEISSSNVGFELTPAGLADIFRRLEGEGAHNVNLITGSHFAPQIAEALSIYRPAVPVVWNCSGYESSEILSLLAGAVDIYLPDFKYADASLAARYSGAPDYPDVAAAAIADMRRQVGADVVSDGLMRRGMIIRHLVLPGALKNTFGVIDWLAENVAADSFISLMGQYVPCGRAAEFTELSRRLKPLEYKIAVDYLERAGFYNAFIQESGCADKAYIPEFDGRVL